MSVKEEPRKMTQILLELRSIGHNQMKERSRLVQDAQRVQPFEVIISC